MKIHASLKALALALPLVFSLAHPLTACAAPVELQMSDQHGTRYVTAAMKGRVVVLSYWMSSCRPCVQEMPGLNKLVGAMQGKEVVFLAPAMDNQRAVDETLKAQPFSYTVVYPEDDKFMDLFPSKTLAFPLHVVIGRDGEVVYRKAGSVKVAEIRKAIQGALKRPA